MKNCNCKETQTTTLCKPDPCNFVYKMPVDECTNKVVYYITLASAVLMECSEGAKTVEQELNEIKNKLIELDYINNEDAWQNLINKLKLHLTDLDPELTNLIKSLIALHLDGINYDALAELFEDKFNEWKDYLDDLLGNINNIEFDQTPTQGSTNAVTSNGIYEALGNKADKSALTNLANLLNNKANQSDLTNLANSTIKSITFEYNDETIAELGSKTDGLFTIPMTGTLAVRGADDNINTDITKYKVLCLGDVNGDGVVDVADVNAVINVMLGKAENDAADINNDGVTGIDDVNTIINLMLGKIDPGYEFRVGENTWMPIKGLAYYNISKGKTFVIYEKTINNKPVPMYWDEDKVSPSYKAIKTAVEELENDHNVTIPTENVTIPTEDVPKTVEVKLYFENILLFNSDGELTTVEIAADTMTNEKTLIVQNDQIGVGEITTSKEPNDNNKLRISISLEEAKNPKFNKIKNSMMLNNVAISDGSVESYIRNDCDLPIGICSNDSSNP